MQPSARQQELERLYNQRKGHLPKISISDSNHHITEAIGSYYDDDGHTSPKIRDDRPLSYMNSPSEEAAAQEHRAGKDLKDQRKSRRGAQYFDMSGESAPPVPSLDRKGSNGDVSGQHEGGEAVRGNGGGGGSPGGSKNSSRGGSVKRMSSLGSAESINVGSGPASPPPPLSRQNSGETAVQQFPLNDIDYESSPAAVAQELSNLQAIRRMSMNVDSGDPDLPGFGGGFGSVPTVAPTGDEDEDDASRLFWVPARLHPELAPKEFKTFIEDKVDRIRRRSGDSDSLGVEGLERTGSSSSSLRRKKSMLSHQVDPKGSYEDGAERLERKRSKRMPVAGETQVELSELESLVNDPAQLMRRMSLDTVRKSQDSGVEVPASEDMPILPPVSQSLKRSTRTTYRRGSLKKGERVPHSRRVQQRRGSEVEEPLPPLSATFPPNEEPPAIGLSRVQTEPVPAPAGPQRSRDEFPERKDSASGRGRRVTGASRSSEDLTESGAQQQQERLSEERSPRPSTEEYHGSRQPKQFHSRLASGTGRTTAQLPGYNNTNPLPHIVETLPDGTKVPVQSLVQQIPERKSSHESPRPYQRGGAHMRPVPGREQHQRSQTLDDISAHPSPMPGHGGYNSRTDALTMIPTFDEKIEKKDGSRKSSWKWLGMGSGDDEKKGKERTSLDSDPGSMKSAKGSTKLLKAQPAEKARLDVLQSSIDGSASTRGRESIVLNRDDVKLEDERRKEGKRAAEGKKDKEKDSGGLLSAIFSSKKKTSDSDLHEKSRKKDKRSSGRKASPSPEPPRILKPDIDYNWTRFSILEERAIYRMAHIKLANPRRALYSQVLLSNFMYSYLAKVQMMHPQVQIPPAHQQKNRGGEKKDEQPAEYSQYQRYQQSQDRRDRADSQGSVSSNGSYADAGAAQQQPQQQRSGFDTTSDEESGGYDTRSSEEYEYDQQQQQQAYHQQQQQQQAYQDQQYARQNGGGGGGGYQQQQAGYGSGGPVGGNGGGNGNGGQGYSVSGSRDYLGYSKDEQPFDSRGLWDDERKDEELW